MTIRSLPAVANVRPIGGIQFSLPARAMDRWNPGVRAADADTDRSISVYDVIGYDYWSGDGVTSKRIAGALRGMGEGPVTVNINSPGGDMFEGLAIYNLLREHPGEVTVRVMGLAASAASVIAMAGDTIQIARAGFFMVHNAWVVAMGNRNDLVEAAAWLEPFDRAMADIYAARTGDSIDEVLRIMDAETWIGGADAIERGMADELLPSDQVEKGTKAAASLAAVRKVEALLRQTGMAKAEAVRLISEMKAGAGDPVGHGEGDPADPTGLDPERAARLMSRFDTLSTLI